jgi:hypothetical protein
VLDAVLMAMAETTQFTIGADISYADGVCGEMGRVVIDPVASTLTSITRTGRPPGVAGRLRRPIPGACSSPTQAARN